MGMLTMDCHAERIRLLVHILCELKDSHGVTAAKLKDAGLDVRRQIQPEKRLQVLDEIYYVRNQEELYLDGKISESTTSQYQMLGTNTSIIRRRPHGPRFVWTHGRRGAR